MGNEQNEELKCGSQTETQCSDALHSQGESVVGWRVPAGLKGVVLYRMC